jgi:hypothetical protein
VGKELEMIFPYKVVGKVARDICIGFIDTNKIKVPVQIGHDEVDIGEDSFKDLIPGM